MPDAPLRFCLAGANGRMGRTLLRLIAERDDMVVTAATTRADDPDLGKDAGTVAGLPPLDLPLTADIADAVATCDGILDFTTPQATLLHGREGAARGRFMVSGTTGIDGLAMAALEALAKRMPIFHTGNFSVGIAVLARAVEAAVRELGPGFDVEVIDYHHRHKVDSPSGTALMLGEAAARARDVELGSAAIRGRDGQTGARPDGGIGFAGIRGGSIIGQHDVVLAGPAERLVFSHMAEDRSLFAEGALRAARWLADQPPGLYGMSDLFSPPSGNTPRA
ncbi:MAG: 4-hydroxy-tetrahydrodipicolinate reductase [Alphaproteobacteria bacterium]